MSILRILLGSALLVLLGCGGSTTQLKSNTLPPGATFFGVWQSPQYGNMHICQTGPQVFGDYFKNERDGNLQGKSNGNLMRFTWEDRRELVQARPTIKKGRGYFRIAIGEDGDQYLRGEWGFDDSDHGGGPWNAVKLRRAKPERCMGGAEQDEVTKEVAWDDDDADVDVSRDK